MYILNDTQHKGDIMQLLEDFTGMARLVILFLLVSCNPKNKDGAHIMNVPEEKANFCVNGWKYFFPYDGLTLYLDKNGKPVPCSMEETE